MEIKIDFLIDYYISSMLDFDSNIHVGYQ
jgi:hypothetical protein